MNRLLAADRGLGAADDRMLATDTHSDGASVSILAPTLRSLGAAETATDQPAPACTPAATEAAAWSAACSDRPTDTQPSPDVTAELRTLRTTAWRLADRLAGRHQLDGLIAPL